MQRQTVVDEWKARVDIPELAHELDELLVSGNEEALDDAFYQDLAFGTAGLRGVVGCGTNRMNHYTVGKATQGFADHLRANAAGPSCSVCIARDSRHKGAEFVERSACVLAANGIEVFVFPRIAPTPALSFAVRHLGCDGGICMTASHNPAPYNGYKVYNRHGCQITSQAAADISQRIENTDAFDGVKSMSWDEAVNQGLVHWIDDEVLDAFIDTVMGCSVADKDAAHEPLSIVYTPLNGTGLECCMRMFESAGFDKVTVVESQKDPNGDFPTCPYPNPEERDALEQALALAARTEADLVLATDPDADRIGVAVRHGGDYRLLTGNEVGVLMLDYLCKARTNTHAMPKRPLAVSTIVSTQMTDAVAATYGAEVQRVLTGFKYIGDVITTLEDEGCEDRFVLGFEESYGYLSGAHVRDKDAVNAALVVCHMAQHHKAQGHTLVDAMESLYRTYGYFANRTMNIQFPGAKGAQQMQQLLEGLRQQPLQQLASMPVDKCIDYLKGVDVLPAADVLEFRVADGIKVVFRPSGTEPKLKAYLFSKAATQDEAHGLLDALEQDVNALVALQE